MTPFPIERWQRELADATPLEVLRWAAQTFGERITLASALGLEAQVMTHLISENKLPIEIFTLDTGRLFGETYALMAQTESRYDMRFKIYFPDRGEVEALVNDAGTNLFRESLEKRQSCCAVRKVNPLKRALEGKDAWITGLRSEQSVTRQDLQVVSWDENHGMVKINPLLHWTEKDVWTFIHAQSVPYNALMDRGFASIGCAPCTRAIEPGEDVRAGRWWWEDPEHKECGIHVAASSIPKAIAV